MEYQKDFNYRLVKLVEKNRCLWDHNDWGTKKQVAPAWIEIAKELDTSVYMCKEKFRHLRVSYARYLKKSQEKNTETKPYYLADEMKFLIPFLKTKNNKSIVENFNLETDDESNTNVKQEMPSIAFKTAYNESAEAIDSNDDWQDNNSSEPQMTIEEPDETDNWYHKKKLKSIKRKTLRNNDWIELEEDSNDSKQIKRRILTSNDWVDLNEDGSKKHKHVTRNISAASSRDNIGDPDLDFFKCILPDFKQLSDSSKRKVRIEILKLIDDEISKNDPLRPEKASENNET